MKYKAFLVILLLFAALPAGAAFFTAGDEYTLPEGEVLSEDLYVAGGSVVTDGAVEGDVIAAGGKVLINGEVSDDVIAAGGNIDILGTVSDDVRVAGGQVVIGESISGDAIIFAGQVQVLPDVVVGGEVIAAGERVVIDGVIEGDARIYGEDVILNGVVGGNLEVFADNEFRVSETAQVGGGLMYRAPAEVALEDGAVGGEITFELHAVRFDEALLGAVLGAAFLLKVLMLLVAGLLAVVFFGEFSHNFGNYAVANFGKSLLIGFVLFIVVPVVSVLLFVSVIGAFVGIIFVLLYALALVAAKVFAGILTGALLSKWFRKEVAVDWRWAFIGIVVIQLLGLLPVVGWAISAVAMLTAFGALAYFAHERFWAHR